MKNRLINPYKGLRTYQEADAHLFYGRKSEITLLSEQVLSRKSTILSGISGSGKSSLINAGLIPNLKENGFIPIKLTPNESISTSLMDIWDVFCDRIDIEITKNSLQVVSLFEHYTQGDEDNILNKLTKFEYKDEFGFNIYFVLIIDQFEEIFQKKFNLKDVDKFLSSYQILCVNTSRLNNKFLISVRQDYLFEVDRYSVRFPLLQQNRFHLAILNEEQAYEVITSPRDEQGNNYFNEDNATFILQNILQSSDFIRDGIPEQEVDAMLLSLYLYQTVESTINEKDIILPDPDDILNKFYSDYMDFEGSHSLESRLISDTGSYRLSITYKDALRYINDNATKLKQLVDVGIINVSVRGGTEYVELHHDRLCKCANHHITVSEARKKNALKFSAQAYLSIKNRVFHENSFWFLTRGYLEHKSFNKLKSLIIQRFKDFKLGSSEDFTYLFAEAEEAHSYSVVVKLSSKSGYCDRTTYDGISQFELKYVKGMLYSLSFKGKNSEPVPIYTGTSTYNFFYDNQKRLSLIELLDVNNEKQIVKDGYSSVLYIYDTPADKCPSKTFYLNLPEKFLSEHNPHNDSSFNENAIKFAVCHLEGNHGYTSHYNSYGCEDERIFIDSFGRECILNDGFSRIKFLKTPSDELLKLSFFNHEDPVENSMGIHSIEIEYPIDSMGNISKYYDRYGKPAHLPDGTYGAQMIVNYDEMTVSFLHLNENGELHEDNEHQQIQKNWLDSRYNIIKSESINANGEIVKSSVIGVSNNGLITHTSEINYIDYTKSINLFINYDYQCRDIRMLVMNSDFSKIEVNYLYDKEGNYTSIRSYNNFNATDVEEIVESKNYGSIHKKVWEESKYIILNRNKDEDYTDGYICDEYGNLTEDPDYGASFLQNESSGETTIRTFLTSNKQPVLKEFWVNNEVQYSEVFYNGEWKRRTYDQEIGYILWDTNMKGQLCRGYLCEADGTPVSSPELKFDTIEYVYEQDNIVAKLFKLSGEPVLQINYPKAKDNVLFSRKEYIYENGEINLKAVKYYDLENPNTYKFVDESNSVGEPIPAELNGIHAYQYFYDNDRGIRVERYIDKDERVTNGPDGWAQFIYIYGSSNSPYQRSVHRKVFLDSKDRQVNAIMDFENNGSMADMEFIQDYLISYKLWYVNNKGKNAKLFNAKTSRLNYWRRKRFIKNLGLFDFFRNLSIPIGDLKIEKINRQLTEYNARLISFIAEESYIITTSSGYVELLFIGMDNSIKREILNYPQTQKTETIIRVTEAHPREGYNLRNNDVILRFGTWDYFELRRNNQDITGSFENEFKKWSEPGKKNIIDVTVARKTADEWSFYSGKIEYLEDSPAIGKIQDSTFPEVEIDNISKSLSYFWTLYDIDN